MIAGVIGVGHMGENHARVYSEMKSVDTVNIFDTDLERCESVAAKYGCDPYRTLEALLTASDLVSICTPTSTHHEVCRAAGQYNVPFLVEKPVADSVIHASEVQCAAKCHPSCGVGHIERFNPLIEAIAEIVKDPHYVAIRRHNPGSSRISDSTVVSDLMIHDIDVLLHVLFPGVNPTNIQPEFSPVVTCCSFRFGNAIVSMSASRLGKEKICGIYIESPDFTLIGDYMTQELRIYRKTEDSSFSAGKYTQENAVEKILVPRVEPLRHELLTFIDCVLSETQFPVSIDEGIENMKIAEMIENDRPVGGCGNAGCPCKH